MNFYSLKAFNVNKVQENLIIEMLEDLVLSSRHLDDEVLRIFSKPPIFESRALF